MRFERVVWGALVAALALGGCSYGWDALRPGPDGGRLVVDSGMARDADTGAVTDAGADVDAPDVGVDAELDVRVDAGVDAGPADTGGDVGVDAGVDVGTPDTGPRDTGVVDVGTPDTGPRDTGVVDVGTPDTGPRDTGVVDVGTPDTGTMCTGPTCPCAPTAPAGWCAIGATCTSGACVVGPVAGSLVITEIMNDLTLPLTEPEGEWIEVYNPSANAVNLTGVRVRDAATVSRAIVFLSGSGILGPRSYAVLARSPTLDITGGSMAFATYDTVALNNSGSETVTIETADSAQIDTLTYSSAWPNTEGRSKSLRPPILDAVMNNSAANWCDSSTSYAMNQFGTPGVMNFCP